MLETRTDAMIMNITQFLKRFIICFLIFFFIWFMGPYASAFVTKPLNQDIRGSFVLGPGKVELVLNPGQQAMQELYVTNNIGEDRKFTLTIEDFKGSKNPDETVVLLGDEKGPYSLKDYIFPEITEFTLRHGQQMIIPVFVSIPEDAPPGGLYGSVLVSTQPASVNFDTSKDNAATTTQVVTRLGTLLFVRVMGEVYDSGRLVAFKLVPPDKRLYEKGPITMQLLYQNDGNVHLTPYGVISVKNMFGSRIGEVDIDPWFALPDSVRRRDVTWTSDKKLIGYYTAHAKINRGYNDVVDESTLIFWIIPWKTLIVSFAIFSIGAGIIMWIHKQVDFKVRVKLKKDVLKKNQTKNKRKKYEG